MKYLFAFAAFLHSIPSLALAPDPREGLFAYAHTISFLGEFSGRECREAEGVWVEGHCRVPVSDYVILERAHPDQWNVRVDTVTTNGRSCELSGTAVAASENDLVAVSGAGEGCRLRLSFQGKSIGVKKIDPAACADLCGSNEGLEILEAKKLR